MVFLCLSLCGCVMNGRLFQGVTYLCFYNCWECRKKQGLKMDGWNEPNQYENTQDCYTVECRANQQIKPSQTLNLYLKKIFRDQIFEFSLIAFKWWLNIVHFSPLFNTSMMMMMMMMCFRITLEDDDEDEGLVVELAPRRPVLVISDSLKEGLQRGISDILPHTVAQSVYVPLTASLECFTLNITW